MSSGVCPFQFFGSRFERFCGTTPSSSAVGATELQLQCVVDKLESKVASDSQLMKEMANTIVLLCQKTNVPLPTTVSSATSEPIEEDVVAQYQSQAQANQSKSVEANEPNNVGGI